MSQNQVVLEGSIEGVHLNNREGFLLVVEDVNPRGLGGILLAVKSVYPQQPGGTLLAVEGLHSQRPRGNPLCPELQRWPRDASGGGTVLEALIKLVERWWKSAGEQVLSWKGEIQIANSRNRAKRQVETGCW
ncbi:uncharacterized protein PGTG_19204 [Puccinia graminis f. sp. tritici CRL 75-36-700-3]|uniref:Uncharacterized protein n=1 Tax=Puccinia graminis f. sp. tritici (strain CRL 75-36-700-3 / race SCCL) TaxID=418459 RepID=E3L974_PUCGT|nr:uncharacterized protein PGTG_19204 [Puccinia graminis f. sp. tritici CRL 75-36-700-3]EFP93099.1 hypothetical protein PGTG_19204 [Puccinia graminis f. sp. tritici CRL 75-36-700-3]